MEVLHIGVPTKEVKADAEYIDLFKVYVTNPDNHMYQFEYLRFAEDTWMPKEIQEQPHIAVKVNRLEDELQNAERILVEPIEVDEHLRVSFVVIDGMILELVETK